MLSKPDVRKLAADMEQEARPEWARLGKFVRYARGRQAPPWLPDDAETEYREIARKSASLWLDLTIGATVQGLVVDGYGESGPNMEPSGPWEVWQANNMDANQHPLHRAVETLGYSFLIVLPGEDGMPSMRPEAATRMMARFDDPWDEWPTVAYRRVNKDRVEVYDDEARYIIDGTGISTQVTEAPHDFGVCPVVRFEAQLDLLGTPMGGIEAVIPIQDRIVDATFMLQMAAKYGAFPQRWIAGLKVQNDAAGNPIPPEIKAYVDHIFVASDPDTKFGQFQAATLTQYVEALEAHIRHLAAITQTPPHYLLGSLVNLSAEALAAAESGLQRKIRDRREVLGERYEQALRLAALAVGDEVAAKDIASQVHWQDVESRSLAQTADALLKLSQLGVPMEMLLGMIPGWTQTDVDTAIALKVDPMADLLSTMQDGLSSQVDPAEIAAKADALGVLVRAGATTESAAALLGLGGLEWTGAVPTTLRMPKDEAAGLEDGTGPI